MRDNDCSLQMFKWPLLASDTDSHDLLTLVSVGGVHGDVIWGPALLWLLDLGLHSFLLMILPVLWLVDLITDEMNDNELLVLLLRLAPPTWSTTFCNNQQQKYLKINTKIFDCYKTPACPASEAELLEIARDGDTVEWPMFPAVKQFYKFCSCLFYTKDDMDHQLKGSSENCANVVSFWEYISYSRDAVSEYANSFCDQFEMQREAGWWV